jgi:glycosyltransferase involved in cell wall biosynthesis
MNKYKYRVTIGMPVYNGENFIEDALNSLINQTFDNFEIIISDNASTDRTESICKKYASKYEFIRYFSAEQNVGPAKNYNRVFELANGEYFKWAAHDDMCEPEFLRKCVDALDSDPSAVLCYSDVNVINSKGESVEHYQCKRDTDSKNLINRFRTLRFEHRCYQIFGLIRTDVLRKTPLIGNYAHGDGVLLVRLALMGHFQKIPEYLFISRRHETQSVSIAKTNYSLYTAWFDPLKAGKLTLPWCRVFWEYLVSIKKAPIDIKSKFICFLYLLAWLRMKPKIFLGEIFGALRHLVLKPFFVISNS